MKIIETELEGVVIIEPDVFGDPRGYFMETYNQHRYQDLGIKSVFKQDNMSFSRKGTLRGLHYQYPKTQAKLVQTIKGGVFDVIVDIRRGSSTFGKWIGKYLSDENQQQIFIPEGFAHGFCVASEYAIIIYKCSEFYAPDCERGLLWSDPDLNIDWPIEALLVSDKDKRNPCLRDIPEKRLPVYK
jgi:dTDP-4-dehydrorhamnose 3,5-epimerase